MNKQGDHKFALKETTNPNGSTIMSSSKFEKFLLVAGTVIRAISVFVGFNARFQ